MSLTKQSVVVVTGTGSGIGRALAVRLAREAIAGLAIAEVNERTLAETAELIGETGVKVTSHILDVSDEKAWEGFASDVVNEHGRATHLINNAGVALGGSVSEVSTDEIRWLMDVNFWGVVYGTKTFLPILEKAEAGHIVNISSIFGLIAPPGQAAYCASKYAVRGFTESLRHELEGTNIAVSVVHPGGVKTNIANDARIAEGVTLSEEQLERRRKEYNKNLDRTSPPEAAETILKGIRTRNPRILIGGEAGVVSAITRLFPKRYFAVIDRISGGKMRTVVKGRSR